jgi:hypothetical protein
MTHAWQLRTEIERLALEMLKLDRWAHAAHDRGNYAREGELHTQREDVQAERSWLLRGLWQLEAHEHGVAHG